MSNDSLTTQPQSRNDVSHLANIIEASLLRFQSIDSPMGKVHLKLLGLLVGLGFSAATVSGDLDHYEIYMRTFLNSHPVKNSPKLLKSFSIATAKMLRMSESYFRRSHLSVAHDEFIAIGEVVRDQMVASMQGHEHLVRNVFNPLLKVA